jgi:hypothetical protein
VTQNPPGWNRNSSLSPFEVDRQDAAESMGGQTWKCAAPAFMIAIRLVET